MPVCSREFCHGYFGRAGQICSAHVDHDDRAPIRQRGAQDDRSCQGNACGCQPGSVSWSWCHWSPNSAPSSARPAPSRQVRSSAVRERAGRCSRRCASALSRRLRWSWCGLTCCCLRCSATLAWLPAGGGRAVGRRRAPSSGAIVARYRRAPSSLGIVGRHLARHRRSPSPWVGFCKAIIARHLPRVFQSVPASQKPRRGHQCTARHCIPLLIARSNRGHCWSQVRRVALVSWWH